MLKKLLCFILSLISLHVLAQNERHYSSTQELYAQINEQKQLFIYDAQTDELIAAVPNMAYHATTLNFVKEDSLLVIGTTQGKVFVFDINKSDLIEMPDIYRYPEQKTDRANNVPTTKIAYSNAYDMIFAGDVAGNIFGFALGEGKYFPMGIKLISEHSDESLMGVYDLIVSENGSVLGAHFVKDFLKHPIGFHIGKQDFLVPSQLYQGPHVIGYRSNSHVLDKETPIADKVSPQRYQSWVYSSEQAEFIKIFDTSYKDYANFSGFGLHKDMIYKALSFRFENRIEVHNLRKAQVYTIPNTYGDLLALNDKANALMVGSYDKNVIFLYRVQDGELLSRAELSAPLLGIINISENNFLAFTEKNEMIPITYNGDLMVKEPIPSEIKFTKEMFVQWNDLSAEYSITFGHRKDAGVLISRDLFDCNKHLQIKKD